MKSALLFFGVILSVIYAHSHRRFHGNEQPICGDNEEYSDCGSACPDTCQGPPQDPCPEICLSGCICKSGFVRADTDGACISLEECPEQQPTCGDNEEYSDCGSACPDTCQGPSQDPCPEICLMGCVCKSGFVREYANGPCVSQEKCPSALCSQNEEYNSCGAFCGPTCDNPIPFPCPCFAGCTCKEGFIRTTSGGECIPQGDCSIY